MYGYHAMEVYAEEKTRRDLDDAKRRWLLVLVIFAAVLAVMAVLTVVFGVNNIGPSYGLTVDPAAGLPGLP